MVVRMRDVLVTPGWCLCHLVFLVKSLLLDIFACFAGWKSWSSWSKCSKSCDGGEQLRTRKCSLKDCDGSKREERSCNMHDCYGKTFSSLQGIFHAIRSTAEQLVEGTSGNLSNREPKQRRRQQERHKFVYLVGKSNNPAHLARAFFTFVHFFAVVNKTTT